MVRCRRQGPQVCRGWATVYMWRIGVRVESDPQTAVGRSVLSGPTRDLPVRWPAASDTALLPSTRTITITISMAALLFIFPALFQVALTSCIFAHGRSNEHCETYKWIVTKYQCIASTSNRVKNEVYNCKYNNLVINL